jgi:hypothetical protein
MVKVGSRFLHIFLFSFFAFGFQAIPVEAHDGTPPSLTQPTVAPVHTAAPTEVPIETAEPIEVSTIAPTPEPIVVHEPTEEPTHAVDPTMEAPVVAEPTLEPVPTAAVTPTATPSPTPAEMASPTPSPTTEPVIPFDADITCMNAPNSQAPVAGDTGWSFIDCSLSWKTKNVSKVTIPPVIAPSGWNVVVLNDRQLQDPNQLTLKPQPLNLVDADLTDEQFATSRFHIASRVSCTAETAVTIPLKLNATSGEKNLDEVSTESVLISASAANLPDVDLTSAVFETVDHADGTTESTGVITMNYSNASENCGWNITTVVNDFVSPDGVIPASSLTVVEVNGPVGLTSTQDGGVITVHAAPGTPMPASSTISITVSVPVPESTSEGDYSTTISAKAGAT